MNCIAYPAHFSLPVYLQLQDTVFDPGERVSDHKAKLYFNPLLRH